MNSSSKHMASCAPLKERTKVITIADVMGNQGPASDTETILESETLDAVCSEIRGASVWYKCT